MNDDPTTWSELNWVKNHTRYYFSAAQLGHPGMPSNKKRATFEVTDPNNQCKEALSHMAKLSGKLAVHFCEIEKIASKLLQLFFIHIIKQDRFPINSPKMLREIVAIVITEGTHIA